MRERTASILGTLSSAKGGLAANNQAQVGLNELQRKADALFLETPFDSAVAVAHDRYWYLPVDLLMDDKFPVDQWLSTVDAPVFVAHGTADTTIGVAHGQRVFDLARNKGGLWLAPGADHDQLWAAGEWDKAKAFFAASERAAGR